MAEPAKDNKKTIIAIVLILGAAILGYFLLSKPKEEEETAAPAAPALPMPAPNTIGATVGSTVGALVNAIPATQPSVSNAAPAPMVGVFQQPTSVINTASDLAKQAGYPNVVVKGANVTGVGIVDIVFNEQGGTAYVVNGTALYKSGTPAFEQIKAAIQAMKK